MTARRLDIALMVDARNLSGPLFPAGDPAFFVEQWELLEPRLRGVQLSSGMSLQVQCELGPLTFEVVEPTIPVAVTEDTSFGVVGVRERTAVRAAYRCSPCRAEGRETYGPFICTACGPTENRVCDDDVVVLPGAVGKATCPQHRPLCDACQVPAVARCPGSRCRGNIAWCSDHLIVHSSDSQTSYCRHCFDVQFPGCRAAACRGLGSIACDHVEVDGRACGERRCPRHARQWQVFGPHRAGLGRCDRHHDLSRFSEAELLYQVLAGCAITHNGAPSLPSLRHVLLKARRVAIEPAAVLQLALAVPRQAPALGKEIEALVERRLPAWRQAAAAAADDKAEAGRRVADWLSRHGHTNALAGLSPSSWVRPREGRPGRLYARFDPRYFPRRVRDAAAAELGFEILPETNG